MIHRRIASVLLAPLLVACSHGRSLPPEAASALQQAAAQPELQGELVYEGAVRNRDSEDALLFRYERRVADLDDHVRSSHLTRSIRGEPVVLHQADHSSTYELAAFREIHGQTGLVGQVRVDAQGRAHFQTTLGGRTRARVEEPGAPLHVGPTLFGHLLSHWDSLMAGEVHTLRFAVVENRRSYLFRLRLLDTRADRTTFEMVAAHPVVRLSVPTLVFEFDGERNIVRYSGLVPPLEPVGGRLKKLNATVRYDHSALTYR